jgi:uncharacterized membrane protein
MKKCRSCKKEIEDGARKCDKCGSYQTFSGRFINMGIPVISILLALVSWTQTYMENMDKKKAEEQKIVAEQQAEKAREEKQEAVMEKEEIRQENIAYSEALTQIESDVRELKTINIQSPEYRQRLNAISNRIETTQQPVRIIDGQKYKKIE